MNEELQRCSGCKSTILLECFSKNRKGNYYKVCDGCRTKVKCLQCAYTCSRNEHMRKHMKAVHLHQNDLKCSECDFKCSNDGNLSKHFKAVHLKLKSYECKECDFKCSNNDNLQRHVDTVHKKIQNFKCDVCDRMFDSKAHLQRHTPCTGDLRCSRGEKKVMQTLDEMNIEYEHDKLYELKNAKDKWLRWDFIIQTDAGPMFVEYDGRQHFGPVCFGGMSKEKSEAAFERQKIYDKLKNEYCSENKYELLRIPYTEFGNIPQLITEFICTHTQWNG